MYAPEIFKPLFVHVLLVTRQNIIFVLHWFTKTNKFIGNCIHLKKKPWRVKMSYSYFIDMWVYSVNSLQTWIDLALENISSKALKVHLARYTLAGRWRSLTRDSWGRVLICLWICNLAPYIVTPYTEVMTVCLIVWYQNWHKQTSHEKIFIIHVHDSTRKFNWKVLRFSGVSERTLIWSHLSFYEAI